MRVSELAAGRAGDKGATLDLTLAARDAGAYELLRAELTDAAVARVMGVPRVERYELRSLCALKFVVPQILGGGVHASLRAGMHWQKAAINALLDMELSGRPEGHARFCVRPPGWLSGAADGATAFEAMRAWTLRAEALGFDGLFVGDRLLAEAVGSESSAATVYGASMLEATATLSALAAVTRRMLLGPLVMVLPYRHPLQLAKAVATLDSVAGGRLVLGAGLGWNETEFTALEIDRSRRARRFEECLEICRALWAGETVSWDGEWTFSDARLVPLPPRRGGPPVWIASFSPGSALDWTDDVPPVARRTLDRVGRLADGWVPLVYSASARRRLDPDVLGRAWDRVLGAASVAGRERGDIDFVHSDWGYVIDSPADETACREALRGFFSGSWAEARRTYLIGSADEIAERLAEQTARIDAVDAYVLTPLGSEPGQLDALSAVRARMVQRTTQQEEVPRWTSH